MFEDSKEGKRNACSEILNIQEDFDFNFYLLSRLKVKRWPLKRTWVELFKVDSINRNSIFKLKFEVPFQEKLYE